MANTAVHFQSQSFEWRTPTKIFDELNSEFGGFDLDPCATKDSAKGRDYYTAADGWSGLAQVWVGKVFVNPPYGRQIGFWMKKAWESSQLGATVVCLIPSRTDTTWWHEYVMKADEVRFIKGRLKFTHDNGTVNSAPFPSCVVVFRGVSGEERISDRA